MRVVGIILICGVIFLLACNTIESFTTSDEEIEEAIVFKMIIKKEPDLRYKVPGIYLFLETDKLYGCLGFNIKSESKIEGNTIKISIFGIEKHDPCATALGPATAHFRYDIIEDEYNLDFKGLGYEDHYKIIVSDTIIIYGDGTENTRPVELLFNERIELP